MIPRKENKRQRSAQEKVDTFQELKEGQLGRNSHQWGDTWETIKERLTDQREDTVVIEVIKQDSNMIIKWKKYLKQ